jgi:hypothetical protein
VLTIKRRRRRKRRKEEGDGTGTRVIAGWSRRGPDADASKNK